MIKRIEKNFHLRYNKTIETPDIPCSTYKGLRVMKKYFTRTF